MYAIRSYYEQVLEAPALGRRAQAEHLFQQDQRTQAETKPHQIGGREVDGGGKTETEDNPVSGKHLHHHQADTGDKPGQPAAA